LLGEDLNEDQTELLRKIREMQEYIDNTCQNTNRLSVEMRPSILNHLGLIAVIRWEVKEYQNRTGTICDIVLDQKKIPLDWDCSTAVFRIFQKLLSNMERHSEATRMMVSFTEKDGTLELMVMDNGKGITKEQINNPNSWGITEINERVEFLGGEIEIKGIPDKGTTITVRIPLQAKNQDQSG